MGVICRGCLYLEYEDRSGNYFCSKNNKIIANKEKFNPGTTPGWCPKKKNMISLND